MKKILFLYFILLSTLSVLANDGIQFSEGAWKEILAKAKQENKLVFIDVYTSWCGPCKMMAAETFPLKEVGDVFNANFVNYKIDAEKGEGVEIAKKFDVRAFPTYLFVNGDGDLVYRVVGYMKAAPFLNEAKIAIQEKNDPKPFVQWENEYNNGKRDKDFLLAYLKKRALLKLPSADITEETFPLLSSAELKDKELMSSIVYYDPAVQFVPNGKVFNFVLNNYKMLDSLHIVDYPLGIMEVGIDNYFKKNIITNKQEKMLPVMIASQKRIMKLANAEQANIVMKLKEIAYVYYDGTNNLPKLRTSVIDYVNNGIMKLDIAGKQKADAEGYNEFMKPYRDGQKDSLTDPMFSMMNRMKKGDKMLPISYNMRSAAEAIYNNFDDKKMLNLAAGWANKANQWFPHFSTQAVYSGLLFKLGQHNKAIKMMTLASEDSFLAQAADVKKLLVKNIETMTKGVLPTNLWKVTMPTTVSK
ncbi:MAG: thioredoxin family protein [Chitinophagaceae bacterium]|nr:MAG: thioredoxin family protein [Chitinophagaceae bacterium]